MGKMIPKRGKPPFLRPEDVEDGDLVTILEVPTVQPAEDSRFGKERTIIVIALKRNKRVFRWGLNNTSNDSCVDAFSGEDTAWVNQIVKIEKRIERVGGKAMPVLYAIPQMTPKQQNLSAPTA